VLGRNSVERFVDAIGMVGTLMRGRQLAGLMVASALVTLDGTAATVALPAIARDFSASISRLQWIGNAPLLMLAAMLLPAGTLADRYGRVRMIRIGLLIFVAASIACAAAQSDAAMIGARFLQGAGGALVLPAALAMLRGASSDAGQRTRIFGAWAAWTGAAAAAGPLLAGALVDFWTWRAVFVPSIAAAVAAVLLLEAEARGASATRSHPIPGIATLALVVLLGGVAYLLIEGPNIGLAGWRIVLSGALAAVAAVVLVRDPRRHLLLPPELMAARNCVPANVVTFSFYFGMFGLSFLMALYAQQALGYSALRAAIVILPISVMLLFAERFGYLATRLGTRPLIVAGALSAAVGTGWMAAGPHPLPFWSHMIVGMTLFGLGISLAVSALTHAAVAAVPETCAGAASGLNHATVRAAGLVAIALLGSIAAPGWSDAVSTEGVQRAMIICAAVVAAGGLAGSALLRDEEPGGLSRAA
jgi:MFS family permease